MPMRAQESDTGNGYHLCKDEDVGRQGRRPYQNRMEATTKDRASNGPVGAGVPAGPRTTGNRARSGTVAPRTEYYLFESDPV